VKGIKVLGLAALVALALTAFSGTASASPQYFKAEKYPATVTGEQGSYPELTKGQMDVVSNWGEHWCGAPKLTAELKGSNEALAASTSGETGCGTTTLQTNGCTFTFHPEQGTFEWGGCSGISVNMSGCHILFPPKAGLPATFTNFGSGSTGGVEVQFKATSLKNELATGCTEHPSFNNGTITGSWKLKATHEGASTSLQAPLIPGFSVTGSGEARKFHSEVYPVAIGGVQIIGEIGGVSYEKVELKTGAGALRCKTLSFSSASPSGLTEDGPILHLTPSYEGCTVSGVSASVTPPGEGCSDTFSLLGSNGELGICGTTVTVSTCVITIPAQTHSGLETANVGTGSNEYAKALANVKGLEYQVSGSNCPISKAPGSYSDGKYLGAVKLSVAKVL
jgi:hypothetical protein